MEDYIFLIIAIILSIFGAINKKKKLTDENQQQFAGKPQRTRNSFLDQLLGEDFLEYRPKEIKHPVRDEPLLKTEAVKVPTSLGQPGIYHMGFKSTLPERKKRTTQTLQSKVEATESESEPEETDSFSYLEDFSLRKAFIYSEILQRKY